jgi:hypothetical protein
MANRPSTSAFVTPGVFASSFTGRTPSVSSGAIAAPRASYVAPRAALNLVPGVPPGQDARDNAPMRYYVPRPLEDYSNRGFAYPLPKTWEGETATIGAADVPAGLTEESIAEAKLVPVDAKSTQAFLDYSRMVDSDRKAALAALQNPEPSVGRATCGETEGRGFVSNYRKELVFGVKCVEYWGVNRGVAN